MILDIDKFKKFRRAHDNSEYSFHNINEMLTYFIKNGYLDIDNVSCLLYYENLIKVDMRVIKFINNDYEPTETYWVFYIVLDDWIDINDIKNIDNSDMDLLNNDLYNRYNKLLRMYKIEKLVI